MRTIAEISADPLATRAEVIWLKTQDDHAALLHPNCPVDLWWSLMGFYPVLAMRSPCYGIMTLEAPGRWQQMQDTLVEKWVQHHLYLLTLQSSLHWMADCGEHLYEQFWAEVPPHLHSSFRRVIQARRDFADNKIASAAWETARESTAKFLSGIQYTAWSQVGRCLIARGVGELIEAATAAHTNDDWSRGIRGGKAKEEEMNWQWERMLFYLREEGIL